MRKLIIIAAIPAFFACNDNEPKFKEIYSEEQLGELLFFDPLLSGDSTISCASCHKPEFAFADNTPTSIGVHGRKGDRNTPSAMNQSARNFQFWDGREETLEGQALGPIENPVEMDLPISTLIERLYKHPQYPRYFMKVYGKMPNRDNIAKAIAVYERTLETTDTPFDDYMKTGDTSEFSASARRGQEIFNVKGKCFDCHFGPDFTNDMFRNLGLFNGKDLNDSGRFKVTRKQEDIGRFKTPGLRNIAVTAPYMHNGMHKTLREVIDYYDEPDKFVNNSVNRDSLLNKPLGLTEQDKVDLENFLLTLTDRRFKKNKEVTSNEKKH